MHLSVSTGRRVMGRLPHGVDLLEALEQCCAELNITLGEVRALGAVSQARVGCYHQASQQYQWLELPQPLEIVSLIGNVSLKDGKTFVHAHVVLSDEAGRAYGGHLAQGTRVFACEFILQEYQAAAPLARQFDTVTGLFLWPMDRAVSGEL